MKKDDPRTPEEWQLIRDTILLLFYNIDVNPKYTGNDYRVDIESIQESLERDFREIPRNVIISAVNYLVEKQFIKEIANFHGQGGLYRINNKGIDEAEKIKKELPKRQNVSVLNHFYELAKKQQKDLKDITFNFETFSVEIGLPLHKSQEIFDRLRSEGLIEVITDSDEMYRITNKGMQYLRNSNSLEDYGDILMPADEISNKVFIVHGHNNEVKEKTARFIEKLGLEAIILHEQANKGRTIIEKFTDHSDVGFAVVLLTGDDIGKAKGDDDKTYKPRARQNVILELGFFLGKLGRDRVCAIYQEGVEIPSDYSGVIWVPLDSRDSWKYDVAKELKAAGFAIDMNKI